MPKTRRRSKRNYISRRKTKKYQNGGKLCIYSVFKTITRVFGKNKGSIMTLRMRELVNSTDKICHHYSLFSLIGDKVPIDPQSITNEFFFFADKNKIYDMTQFFSPAIENREKKIFKVRLYKFSKNSQNDGYIVHTSRYELEHWWHKFNGIDCLVAFDEQDFENFGDVVIREINVEAYDVPATMYEDGHGLTIKTEVLQIT